jgi:hypothetical protein
MTQEFVEFQDVSIPLLLLVGWIDHVHPRPFYLGEYANAIAVATHSQTTEDSSASILP